MSSAVQMIDAMLVKIKERVSIDQHSLADAIDEMIERIEWLEADFTEQNQTLLAWVKATACAKPEHVEAYTKVQTDTILALQEKVKRLEGEKADQAIYNKVIIKSGFVPQRIKEDAQKQVLVAQQARLSAGGTK